MGGMIFSVFFALIGIVFLNVEGMSPTGGVLLIVISIWLFVISKSRRDAKKKAKKEYQKEKEEKGFIFKAVYKHMAGLPLAEGVETSLYLNDDGYSFRRNENTYNLPFSKVTDVTITTSTEIQSSYSSSVGGAVGGAVLFGPLGAMVGGRNKERKSTVEYKYIVFSYEKDEKAEYISFDITPPVNATSAQMKDFNLANNFVIAFKGKHREEKEIQL